MKMVFTNSLFVCFFLDLFDFILYFTLFPSILYSKAKKEAKDFLILLTCQHLCFSRFSSLSFYCYFHVSSKLHLTSFKSYWHHPFLIEMYEKKFKKINSGSEAESSVSYHHLHDYIWETRKHSLKKKKKKHHQFYTPLFWKYKCSTGDAYLVYLLGFVTF